LPFSAGTFSGSILRLQRLRGRRHRFLAGLAFGGRLLDASLVRDGEIGGGLRRFRRFRRRLVLRDRLAVHAVGRLLRTACARAVPAPGAMVGLGVESALRAFLFFDQRLPVGDRDLIIVRMNFAERQEAMAIAAVIDEGRLERRFDARDFGEIDIAAELLTLGRFEVEFLDAIAAQDDYPGFLRMGRVDEHFVGHWRIS
jgi:hypothetical protein